MSFEKAFGDQISLSGDHFTEGGPQKEISENLEVGALCKGSSAALEIQGA